MHTQLAKLILYRNLGSDSVLTSLAQIFAEFDSNTYSKSDLTDRIYAIINKILDISTTYGFNTNLWHNYLTFVLITNENPFTLTCEKAGASDGSVNEFAINDFTVFRELFNFDFTKIEKALGINCFSLITNYTSIPKKERAYYKSVSEKVQALSQKLGNAQNSKEFFDLVTGFYKDNGVGMFGLNKAFRIRKYNGVTSFVPVNNTDKVLLSDLVGYEVQKQQLIDNTKSFVLGKKANNVLLYGDSGTGKSTSVKAVLNEYADQGLRMIEIYKHQFEDLSYIISQIKNRNYRFIIFMDDLSFEEFEIEYKYLKAVIEGGMESKPENVLIYATSNRRHFIRETFSDRSDMAEYEVHRSDTMQEKLSLADRFGVSINYSNPTRKEYHDIVLSLAKKQNINLSDEEIIRKADQWEIGNGGISGRTAQQFINHIV